MTDKNKETFAHILNSKLHVFLSFENTLANYIRLLHWNYKGENFISVHKELGRQYSELAEIVDVIAEKIRTICDCDISHDVLNLNLEDSNEEFDLKFIIDKHQDCLSEIESIMNTIGSNSGFIGCQNMLSNIVDKHENMIYLLKNVINE
jgi:starvation-inducible DNA-binding protein